MKNETTLELTLIEVCHLLLSYVNIPEESITLFCYGHGQKFIRYFVHLCEVTELNQSFQKLL